MGLVRGVARTAVIAGTATAVSNNVSRRQQRRWAGQQEAAPPPPPPPPSVPAQAQQPPMEQAAPEDDLTAKLDRLMDMKARGLLTDEEFAAAKAKLLGL
jgi:hypothetical protein